MCSGEPAATSDPSTLSGGTVDATEFTQTPGSSGGYSFQAVYGGDGVYNGSTGACEPLDVGKVASTTVTEIHNANHDVVTSVPAGTTVHDKATVSGDLGAPTGDVTFNWFTNNECSGEPAATSDPSTLSGGTVDATEFTQTPGSSGGYSFQAVYGGDDVYSGSTGACEPLDVGKVASTTVTEIHNANHDVVTSVPAGTTVHDQATVSGDLGAPTGDVTFKWFTNDNCSGELPAATSDPFSLSGGTVDATTFTQTPGSAGGYSFRAVYAGDDVYEGSIGACEPLTATSPPPPPYVPQADITVTKAATPSVRAAAWWRLGPDHLQPGRRRTTAPTRR